jgi:hypothetical protein
MQEKNVIDVLVLDILYDLSHPRIHGCGQSSCQPGWDQDVDDNQLQAGPGGIQMQLLAAMQRFKRN